LINISICNLNWLLTESCRLPNLFTIFLDLLRDLPIGSRDIDSLLIGSGGSFVQLDVVQLDLSNVGAGKCWILLVIVELVLILDFDDWLV
jgi:hypothetical protein